MRCIKCGSRKVSLVKINEGYSFTKGIVGQAVLGPVGAVAGINGKTSQVYHCSECGQDEITIMPDVIERFINEAIQKNDVRSLKDYKKQYPGIEWEDTTPVISQREVITPEKKVIEKKSLDNTTDNERTTQKEISVSALANMIREYINEMNAPVEKEDLCAKYDEIGRAKVYSAISDLRSKGKIKEVAEDVYVIVRDYEEMQCLAEAEKQKQQNEEDAVQQIVPELIKKATAFDNKITIDPSGVFYYLDTSGTVLYEDLLLEEYRRGSRERRERNRFIIENGQDVKEFIIESDYIVFLMKDATVRIWFSSSWKKEHPEWENYQRNIEGWEEVVSVHQNDGSFVGLRKDGSLVATGLNKNGQYNVDGWDNIKKIQFCDDYCYVLRKDGTMTINGIRKKGFEMFEVDSWTDIIDFEACSHLNLIALHEDGSVSACGRAKANEVKNWENVDKIYAGAWCVSAITSEGRAYSTQIERAEVNNWRNIVKLIVSPFSTIGLKADGTIVVFEVTDKISNKICDWKNVVSIMSPSHMFSKSINALILGVRKDGTVICSEPAAEDAVKKIKLFNNYNTIDEEVEQADKEAVSRLAEQASVRKELRIIHEQLDDEKKALDSLEMEHKGTLASLNRDRIEAHVPAEKEIAEINDRIRGLRNRYSTLGFFKKKEKKEIDTAIAEAEEALKKAEREREAQKAELIRSLDEKISILKKDYEEQVKSLFEKILSLQKEAELKSKKSLSERASQIFEEWAAEDQEREVILELILEEMKKSGKQLLDIEGIQRLPGVYARRLTIYEVSTYVYDLVADGKIRREMNGKRIMGFCPV